MSKPTARYSQQYDDLFGASPTAPVAKPVAASKPKPKPGKPHSRKRKRRQRPQPWLWWVLALVLILLVGPLALRQSHPGQGTSPKSSHLSKQTSADDAKNYVDTYPLRKLLTIPGPVNLGKSLAATVKGHTISFNRGYQFTVADTFNLTVNDRESAVLPTRDDYAATDVRVVSLEATAMRPAADVPYVLEVRLYSNLVNGYYEYFERKPGAFYRVIKQANLGPLQTGLIWTYRGSDDQIKVDRYYMFPDGTAIVVHIVGDLLEGTAVPAATASDAALLKAVAPMMAVVDRSLKLTAISQ